jgi:hypothetical protein
MPILLGVGPVLTPRLVTWLGNRRSTRHSWGVITLRPGALLEISFLFSHASNTPKLYNIIFLTGEDEYSQDQFPAIQLCRSGWRQIFAIGALGRWPIQTRECSIPVRCAVIELPHLFSHLTPSPFSYLLYYGFYYGPLQFFGHALSFIVSLPLFPSASCGLVLKWLVVSQAIRSLTDQSQTESLVGKLLVLVQ